MGEPTNHSKWFAIQLVSGESNLSRPLPPDRHALQKTEKSKGGESVEPVGEVHPDVGGPHHHLHHRQPLPPLLAKYALFRNPTVSNRYRTEPRTVFRMNKFLV